MRTEARPAVEKKPWVTPSVQSGEAFTQISLGCAINPCLNDSLTTRTDCLDCGYVSAD
jgi:hypothetical protein